MNKEFTVLNRLGLSASPDKREMSNGKWPHHSGALHACFWAPFGTGGAGKWHRERPVAAAQLCSPKYCLPCAYLANSTARFPTGSLDPPPPGVGIKCWVKRLSRGTGCSPLWYHPHLVLQVTLRCGCWKTCLCQQMVILKMSLSLRSIAQFILSKGKSI